MIKNRDMSAKPLDPEMVNKIERGYGYTQLGLTKLEYAAIAAMQGLLADNSLYKPEIIAMLANDHANAIFDELEKSDAS